MSVASAPRPGAATLAPDVRVTWLGEPGADAAVSHRAATAIGAAARLGREAANGVVKVWLLVPSPRRARSVGGALVAEELARASRVRAERRVKFTAVRGTLRELLASQIGIAPREVPIVHGEHGKPALHPELGGHLHFNVSHTGGLAAIALCAGREVGVDVELHRPRRHLELLAQAALSPAERDWYADVPEAGRLAAFLDVWTAKEAYSKLLGRGLRLSFRGVALDHPAADRTGVTDGGTTAPCVVRRLPVGPRHSAALAA